MFLEEGTSEISLSGLVDFDTVQGTYVAANVFYGYFIMDYLSVGPVVAYFNDNSFRAWAVGPKAEYNFDIGYSLVPYVGGALKFATRETKDLDMSNNAGVATLELGAKFLVSEYAAISAALVGDAATDDLYMEGDEEASSTDIRLEVGMRIFF
jgi:hypothetical protein